MEHLKLRFIKNLRNITTFFLGFFPLLLLLFLSNQLLSFGKGYHLFFNLSIEENIQKRSQWNQFKPNLFQLNPFSMFFWLKNNLTVKNDRLNKIAYSQEKEVTSNFIKTIVLDPGHGGEEVGATGPTGLLEKDVALDVCRHLKNILNQKHHLKVTLTRNSDIYIPLANRIEKANNQKADLFISIHTNASKRRAARGAESYFLSYEAVDKETKELADMENQGFSLDSIDPNTDKDLQIVLWHMAQAEYLAESSQLAELIQIELNEVLGVTERGIKQAPFFVLMGAQMPAVLIEVAFITNPYEEKMLKSNSFKIKIAQALYRGIYNYIQLYNARMKGVAEKRQ